jgi:hypothetical protein
MRSIQVGIQDYPPLFKATGPDTIEGILGPYAVATVKAVFGKINITYVPLPVPDSTGCSSDGLCTNTLGYMQRGQIDYLRPTSYAEFEALGTNLTFTSTAWESDCFFVYKKKLSLNLHYSTFSGLIFSFDATFWLSLVLAFLTLLTVLHLNIKRRQPSKNLLTIQWNLLQFICGQNYNSYWCILHRLPLALLIFPLLFTGKLLSGSLQTGLVSNQDYLKLETLSDIIKYDYQPIIFKRNDCGVRFLQVAPELVSNSIVFSRSDTSLSEIYGYARQDEKVAILPKLLFINFKNVGCALIPQDEADEPLDISDKPLFKSVAGFFMNKLAPTAIKAIISRHTHSAFEGNLVASGPLNKISLKCIGLHKVSPSCTERKLENKVLSVPISWRYLRLPFIILTCGYLLAMVIMVIEYLI